MKKSTKAILAIISITAGAYGLYSYWFRKQQLKSVAFLQYPATHKQQKIIELARQLIEDKLSGGFLSSEKFIKYCYANADIPSDEFRYLYPEKEVSWLSDNICDFTKLPVCSYIVYDTADQMTRFALYTGKGNVICFDDEGHLQEVHIRDTYDVPSDILGYGRFRKEF